MFHDNLSERVGLITSYAIQLVPRTRVASSSSSSDINSLWVRGTTVASLELARTSRSIREYRDPSVGMAGVGAKEGEGD